MFGLVNWHILVNHIEIGFPSGIVTTMQYTCHVQ